MTSEWEQYLSPTDLSWDSSSSPRGCSRGRGRAPRSYGYRGYDRGSSVNKGVTTKKLLEYAESEVSDLSDISTTILAKVDLHSESSLVKRLFREYIQIKDCILPYVCVSPLPHNFLEWHGNLKGPEGTPYEGGVFHFSIQFGADYPRSSPDVMMLTRLAHPCVEDSGQVILDILDSGSATKASQRYTVWSPAYTVSSILIQLQALLFDGTAEVALQNLTDLSEYAQEIMKWESGVRFSVEQSFRFSCGVCKHRPRNYWPAFPEVSSQSQSSPTTDSLYLENAICFYTQRTHTEVPLGIGINCTKDLRTGHIQNVHCVPDIISLNAFRGSKITEAWAVSFSNWFPIYIHESHPERSIYLAQRSLSSMYAGSPNDFRPSMALDFFPRILSHVAVCFANSEEGGDAVRYLHTYCYMHRMFLAFLSAHPSLLSTAKESLRSFINDPAKRHMDITPSLGHLVVFLGVTDVTWEELATAYLLESQDRNARRIIKRYPELNTSQPDPKVDAQRISKSFTAYNISGLRFLMMQLTFNRTFVSYNTEQCDKYYTLLPKDVEEQLLNERKNIQAVNNFILFYERIGQVPPTEEQLVDTLRQAIVNSKEKRYHGDKGIEVLSPEEFEKQRLGAIRPLHEMVTADSRLHDDEDQWRALCETRFCLTELPASYDDSIKSPWKHLYLQHNLQELVSRLNDNPDFKLLYQTLDLSKDCLSRFDLVTFSPDNIRSNYYFLSQIIQQLPGLTHLTMSKGEVGLGEKGFRELVKGMARSSGALKVLDMPHLDITEAHVSKLAETQLTSDCLTCLNLEGNRLGTKGSEMLAQLMMKHHSLPNLEQLNLKACKITPDGMKALAEGLLVKRKIKRLNLSKNQCGPGLGDVIRNLAYSPSIEELALTVIQLTSSQARDLARALEKLFTLTVSLKKVSFWNVVNFAQAFNQSNMKALASNGTIESLDLSETAFTVTDAAPFGTVVVSKSCAMKELDLSNNRLSVNCVKCIVEQAKGRVSPVAVLNLSSNSRLFERLNPKMSKQLVTFFSHTFSKVTHLNLSHCDLNSQSVEVLGEVLSKDTALRNLDLSFNTVGKHGARILANGLATNTTLEVLRLDKNSIGAAGAHYLAGVLEKPSCVLKELHVFCNYVDIPGTTAICKALHTNKHLEFLDLGLNKVRKRGAAAVVEMLGVNQTLKTLCLKFNYIPDPWAIKIAKQVVESVHCRVSTLKLAGNSLKYETLVTIVTQLHESARDVTFDLSGRAEYRDPERMERTVFVSPLSTNVTPDMIKKMFYSKKCGAIKSVKIEKHRKKKAKFDKAKYALVEFAHKDSVELAIDLVKKGEARIGSMRQPVISQAGLNSSTAVSQ